MIANYHTHTVRCRHAQGTEREYIEAALAAGFKTLGFSDHAPMPFSGSYYSTMRMFPGETEGYVSTLLALREEYRGRIELKIGFEVEYYPHVFADFLKLISQFPIDYLILGQHFLWDEEGSAYVYRATDREDLLHQYVVQCCEALDLGCFTYFAHPDVFHYTGPDEIYRREMDALSKKARAVGIPLELNLLGAGDGRSYPDPRFWQLAGKNGNIALLGCDAHEPAALYNPAAERACRSLAARCGVRLLEDVPLVPPIR